MEIDKLTPLFICGHRKSGTTLMVALLDYHPEVIAYPDDSKFFHLYFPKVAGDDSLTNKEKSDIFIENNLSYLKKVLLERCNADTSYLDFHEFEKIYRKCAGDDKSWQGALKAMIYSFYSISPQKKDKLKYWAEKTTSSEIFALEIKNSFPKAKFIHIIRDPRDNYASLKSGWDKKYRYMKDSATLEQLRQSMIERGLLGMKIGIMNQKVLGDKAYLFVKYENLVKELDATLDKIAGFLEINKSKFDATPTACGLKWKGNNMKGKLFDKPSPEQVGRWI
ncbi:sulfotransferase, partial [Elusimicrobiota bacterium]